MEIRIIPTDLSETTLKRLNQFNRLKRRVKNLRKAIKDLSRAYELIKGKHDAMQATICLLKNEKKELQSTINELKIPLPVLVKRS